jgi:hypothetical protein
MNFFFGNLLLNMLKLELPSMYHILSFLNYEFSSSYMFLRTSKVTLQNFKSHYCTQYKLNPYSAIWIKPVVTTKL